MGKRADDLSVVIHQVRFVGRTSGLVKSLAGFKKAHHTVPDAVNAATSGFLAKLCAEELAEEAESFFQNVRSTFGYKRAQLNLDLASPMAVLNAKDFTFELLYALDEADPASYLLTRALYGVRSGDVLATTECESVFGGQFSELVFVLTKGSRVESVIDAVEGLDASTGLQVNYPSDCSDCTLSVEGVDATVRFDGHELSMVFPKPGSPRELLEAFLMVRQSFSLSKAKVLAGLLG